jgi:hypothetical protein
VSWDFASCPSGWSASGTNNGWQCGKPTTGPGGDHTGGGNTWGTAMSGGAPFCSDSWVTSPSVDLSAYQGLALKLRFWQWHDFRACNPSAPLCPLVCALGNSTYSGGVVEVYNGGQWVKVSPTGGYTGKPIDCYYVDADGGVTCQPCALDGQQGFDGASGAWVFMEMDISSYAHSTFQVRFHFASYANEFLCHPNKAGWYVDDVAIAKLSCP